MGRRVGLVLVALGAVALVLAPLLRWVAYPRLAVTPDEPREVTAVGTDIAVLDIALVTSGAPEVTRTVSLTTVRRSAPDEDAGTDDVAVWDVEVDTTDAVGASLSSSAEHFGFDRRTGEAVPVDDEFVSPTGADEDRVEVDHAGWVVKLPFGTEQRDYPWWDSTIQATRTAVFEGEDEVDGLGVYRFVQTVAPTPVAQLDAPGRLFGAAEALVPAERLYSVERTLWVEPRTGAVIHAREEIDTYLAVGETRGPSVLTGVLEYDDATVSHNVDTYGSAARTLGVIQTGSIVALVLGIVLALAGAALLTGMFRRAGYTPRRARVAAADEPDDDGHFAALRDDDRS